MRDEGTKKGRIGQGTQSTTNRWKILTVGLMLLFITPTAPTLVEASAFKAGATDDPTVIISCSKAVMTTAPNFSSNPKGSAKYPFVMKCISGERAGLMLFTWEGRWNPSETRQDRPNAVETLYIEGWEPFIPGRTGGKLFMYWTARCTTDPWIQDGTCHRYGGYVPDDLRAAFPDIDGRTFPLTENSISPSLQKQLVKQYQAANTPVSTQSRLQNMTTQQKMAIQPQQSQVITQAPRNRAMTVQPQTALQNPNTAASSLSRSGLFSRGLEDKEDQTAGQPGKDGQPASVETSDMAVLEEGTPEIVEPTAVTLDRPLHVVTAKGDAVVIEPGIYEIEPILGLQLGLAKEGHPTVILPANPGTHSESIQRTMALVIADQSNDEQHLVLLTPDGKRIDALGSISEVKSRGTGKIAMLSDKTLKDAIIAASAQSAAEPPPPCQQNPRPTGPRWTPVPCTMASIPEIPTAPVP